MRPTIGVITCNHGTVWSFVPQTVDAIGWFLDEVPDADQASGETYAESRYAVEIAYALLDEGFILQDAVSGRIAQKGDA